MKKKLWISIGAGIVVLVILFILIGKVFTPGSSSASELTEQEAKEIAQQRYTGTVKGISQKADQYIIELERETGIYELQINTNTGEISSLKRVKEANQTKDDIGSESLPKEETLSEEQIKDLALKQVNGKIDSLQLVKEGDQPVYVVIVSDQSEKNKLSLDAYTGDVLKKESSTVEAAPKRLTKEQAMTAALEQVPGTVDGLDTKEINGITFYLVEIEANDGREATVEINAITGKINTLTWDDEQENDDDDDDQEDDDNDDDDDDE
jgi:uncharacterized membrane protein YkoI